jgi:hypothetical protein
MKHYPVMNYSVFETGTENYIDFDIVAFEGPCKVIADGDPDWYGPQSAPYEGELIVNPTWGQLFIEAMKQQQKTLDFGHCYFEGAKITATAKNGGLIMVQFLTLFLGS